MRRCLWVLALCLPAAAAHAAPILICGDQLLQHQRERNALLPAPKPLTRQQLLRSRRASTLPVTGLPLAPRSGDKAKFWTVDFTGYNGSDSSIKHYRGTATLRQITESAYFYVADDVPVNTRALAPLAQAFEQKILPLEQKYFGTPMAPGIDSDPRVTLLITNLRSPSSGTDAVGLSEITVGGYFNEEDEYPNDARHPYSNERQMITLNAALDVGSTLEQEMLAHEYQHLIHWNYDRGEELWVNEGLSMVAPLVAAVADGPQSALSSAIMAYGLDYDNSLTQWSDRGQDGLMSHAGAAGLFFLYLSEKFGGPSLFARIVQHPEHGTEGVLAALSDAGYPVQFADLFTNWAIANMADDSTLGDPPHSYGYSSSTVHNVRSSVEAMHELLPDLLPRLFQPGTQIKSFPAKGSAVLRPQAAHYIELTGTGTLDLSFDGGGQPFEAFVLTQGIDGVYRLHALPLDSQTRVGSDKVAGLGSSISTVYLIVTNVADEGGGPAEYRYEAKIE
jgi:hypothetical protein